MLGSGRAPYCGHSGQLRLRGLLSRALIEDAMQTLFIERAFPFGRDDRCDDVAEEVRRRQSLRHQAVKPSTSPTLVTGMLLSVPSVPNVLLQVGVAATGCRATVSPLLPSQASAKIPPRAFPRRS